MIERKKPELLVPAGGIETLKTAVLYGADAVYMGGDAYGLRANAKNFSDEDLKKAVKFCHERGVKVYITANIYAHNYDIEGIKEYFKKLQNEIRPDAVLISDPGMFSLAREYMPDIDLHISTQANTTNYMSVLFWVKEGAKRIVTARELSLKEIKEIREHIPDDAYFRIILQDVTQTEANARIHAGGNIRYLRKILLAFKKTAAMKRQPGQQAVPKTAHSTTQHILSTRIMNTISKRTSARANIFRSSRTSAAPTS